MKPTCSYPASFARGDKGWAVGVLQKNLNAWRWAEKDLFGDLREDSLYGGQTERAVKTVQRRRGLRIDGVAGPKTQTALGLDLMEPFCDAADIPRCVMRGLVALESGFLVAAVNCFTEGGMDCGWCQLRVKDGSPDSVYEDAFFGPLCFMKATQALAKKRKELGELDWAILAHNWPAAAARYADGSINTWTYTSRGKQYRMRDEAPWITEKHIDGVRTGTDWARFYIGQVKRFC